MKNRPNQNIPANKPPFSKRKKRKRPFYKKSWFWWFVVAVIMLLTVIGYSVYQSNQLRAQYDKIKQRDEKIAELNQINDHNTKLLSQIVPTSNGKKVNSATKLNQPLSLTNEKHSQKLITLTMKNVSTKFNKIGQALLTSSDDNLKLSSNNGIQITVGYQNNGMKNSFLPSVLNFTVFESDGTKAKIINQQDGQDGVTRGKKGQTTFWANLNHPTTQVKKLKIVYHDPTLNKELIFNVPLKK